MKPSPGHAPDTPSQTSAVSHGPAVARHSVPAMVSESAGQVIAVPSQTSCVSQAPADGRQTVPAVLGPMAVHTGAPLVQSMVASSHGLPVSQGNPASQPTMQRPRPEHVPPGQVVPAGSNPSVGQVIDVPSQTSSVSQMSRGARQVVPAG
jgi:hypothetical protein